MRRRVYLAGLAGSGLTALAGCTAIGEVGGALFDGDEYDIGMTRTTFEPEAYETTPGETIVWKNTSEAVHTVTAYEGGIPDGASYFASGDFESETEARERWATEMGGGIDSMDTYEHTFDAPGTYSYCCIPHERAGRDEGRMIGLVHVLE